MMITLFLLRPQFTATWRLSQECSQGHSGLPLPSTWRSLVGPLAPVGAVAETDTGRAAGPHWGHWRIIWKQEWLCPFSPALPRLSGYIIPQPNRTHLSPDSAWTELVCSPRNLISCLQLLVAESLLCAEHCFGDLYTIHNARKNLMKVIPILKFIVRK